VSIQEFWAQDIESLLRALRTDTTGLTHEEAQRRLLQYGLNTIKARKRSDTISILLSQFRSPIILILLFSAILSFLSNDNTDGLIIVGIVLLSSLLGFWQEWTSADAIKKLTSLIRIKAAVVRDGREIEIPMEEMVPGDIAILNAGDIVPGDCRLLDSRDLFVNEATLTGETYPAEKQPGLITSSTQMNNRINTLYMGTSVVSGTGKALLIRTGSQTEFGRISEKLKSRPLQTEFERGVARFGYLLMELVLGFVVVILAFNVYLMRPVFDSFLFALALAVGITPQLLPAVISINLARGARRMAEEKVVVKRLNSIENFGEMDLLCSDKTGTVTVGTIVLHSVIDMDEAESEKTMLYAYLNAKLQSGYNNPIDEAIVTSQQIDVGSYQKIDEIPYDFVRKRLSVLVKGAEDNILICKGALRNILDVCSQVETAASAKSQMLENREKILSVYEKLSSDGYRTLGVAYRSVGRLNVVNRTDEVGMIFLGFVVLHDPLKDGVERTIEELRGRGIGFKIVTGDNELVASRVASQIGMTSPKILTGGAIRQMSDEALVVQSAAAEIFAEVEPNQKERIVLALRASGYVVGYIGDGINDASALHAADVGISVDGAADVAKEAADIVLLDKDLDVLLRGVDSGRKTFANTLKYIFVTISANFGNMLSMAVASLMLPFLPLLPKQILSLNLLTDIPATTISTDDVDEETVDRPRKWNIKFITQFMTVFGFQSTIFDFITFIVLFYVLHSTEVVFQTGWFLLSIITELFALLIIRTRRMFFQSMPSKQLLAASLVMLCVTFVIPYTPLAIPLGLVPLSLPILAILILIALLYLITTELVKIVFYRHVQTTSS
jgi:Mg2+-importing ATPase